MKLVRYACLIAALMMAACGGGGGGNGSTVGGDDGGTTGGNDGGTVGGDDGGATVGGDDGGSTVGGGDDSGDGDGDGSENPAPVSCKDAFSPEKLAAGDNCAPVAETYCANDGSAGSLFDPQVRSCSGVEVSDIDIDTAGVKSHYLAIRPSGKAHFDAVYLGLHYLVGDVVAFANVARLSELAKARNVLVLLPQAPSPLGLNLTSVWPTTALASSALPQTISFLSGVIADGRSRFGAADADLYVAGLSNGAAMAYLFACQAPDPVRAVLAVAGDLGKFTVDECQPTHSLGTVIVHGTADAADPYDGLLGAKPSIPELHAKFKANNHCTGSDATVDMPAYSDPLQVTIAYTGACDDRRRNFLVTVEDGGHVWPGGRDNEFSLPSLTLFGAHTANFDATLQGFDLLRLAGGR